MNSKDFLRAIFLFLSFLLIILSLRSLRFSSQFFSNVSVDDSLKDSESCYKEISYYCVWFPRKRRKMQETSFSFKESQNLTRLALVKKHYNFFLFLSNDLTFSFLFFSAFPVQVKILDENVQGAAVLVFYCDCFLDDFVFRV